MQREWLLAYCNDFGKRVTMWIYIIGRVGDYDKEVIFMMNDRNLMYGQENFGQHCFFRQVQQG